MGCVHVTELEDTERDTVFMDLAMKRWPSNTLSESATYADEMDDLETPRRTVPARDRDFGSRQHMQRSALGQDDNSKRLMKALMERSRAALEEPSSTKFVALVAHNEMKPSMMNFVKKHLAFFSGCRIVTTGSTGAALEKKLGLKITLKVSSGPLGGDQEIGALISQRQLGAVFFFRDPLSSHPHESDIQALARLCDVHNVMASTNPASGDTLVFALQNSKEARTILKTAAKDEPVRDSDVVKAYKRRQAAVIKNVAAAGDKSPSVVVVQEVPKKSVPDTRATSFDKNPPSNNNAGAPPAPTSKRTFKTQPTSMQSITLTAGQYQPSGPIDIEYQLGASEIAMVAAAETPKQPQLTNIH